MIYKVMRGSIKMSDKLNDFIEENFNNKIIESQIEEERVKIRISEAKIEKLKLSGQEVNKNNWYMWNGISFLHQGYSHHNGYRSNHNGTDIIEKYEEFVVCILINTDKDIAFLPLNDDSDFYIISPIHKQYLLSSKDIKNLPLIVEYYEREELNKKLDVYLENIKTLNFDINAIELDCQKTEMYTDLYISNLREQQSKLKDQLTLFEKEDLFILIENRIEEINEILKNVDKILE
jgi:hypothetical protein